MQYKILKYLHFISDIKKSGSSCEEYDGEKKYIATGDIDYDSICSFESVTYNNKPSRANVVCDIGDVLFAKMQNTIKVLVVDNLSKEYIFSTGFYSFRDNRLIPKYLKYFFMSKYFNALKDKNSSGATMKAINDEGMRKIAIPLYSDSDQNKIVEELDSLISIIDDTKKQIDLYEELIKSRFIEMFGDPIDNNYNFPKGIIGDYIVDVRYGTSKPAKDGGNYQYLRMNNLTYDGYLDYENVKYIDATDEDIDKYGIKYGDVLFNRTNSIDLIGKTAVYLENEIKIVAGYIIRVRFNECINPIYFTRYMNLPSTKKILREMAKGAVNQANINAQELKGISLICPPKPLQDEFASFVEQIDKLKFSLQEQIKSLQELLDSKMQEYFGE